MPEWALPAFRMVISMTARASSSVSGSPTAQAWERTMFRWRVLASSGGMT